MPSSGVMALAQNLTPAVLTSEVDEINILLDVRRENGHSVGVDIQVDTNEHGGSFITYLHSLRIIPSSDGAATVMS